MSVMNFEIVFAAVWIIAMVIVICLACVFTPEDKIAVVPPRKDDERLYGLKELEPICGVSRKTLKRYIDAGKLKAEKIEGKWEIKESDLNSFLDWREGKQKTN